MLILLIFYLKKSLKNKQNNFFIFFSLSFTRDAYLRKNLENLFHSKVNNNLIPESKIFIVLIFS